MFRLPPCPSWGSPDVWLFKLQFYSTLLISSAVFAGIPLHLIAFTEQNISNSRLLSTVYMLMTAFTCRAQYLCGSAPHESLSFRFELIVWRSPNWQKRLSHLATHSLGLTYCSIHAFFVCYFLSTFPCFWMIKSCPQVYPWTKGKVKQAAEVGSVFQQHSNLNAQERSFPSEQRLIKNEQSVSFALCFGHDVDPAKQTIPELRSENTECFECQKCIEKQKLLASIWFEWIRN